MTNSTSRAARRRLRYASLLFVTMGLNIATTPLLARVLRDAPVELVAFEVHVEEEADSLTDDVLAALGALVNYLDSTITTHFPALAQLLHGAAYQQKSLSEDVVYQGLVDALAFIAKNGSKIKEPMRSMMTEVFTVRLHAIVQKRTASRTEIFRPTAPKAVVPAPSFARTSANTSVGSGALVALKTASTPGSANSAFGMNALKLVTTGNNNLALGNNAGASLSSGNNNIYLGNTGVASETGVVRIGTAGTHASNMMVGTLDLKGSATFGQNVYLPSTTVSGSKGVLYVGGTRLFAPPAFGNLFLGANTGNFNVTGECNIGIGQGALGSLTKGAWNHAMGYLALAKNTTGEYNVAIGGQALYNNKTGGANTAIGMNALLSNVTGSVNQAFGDYALLSNRTGSSNCAIGDETLNSNRTGSYNVAVGQYALSRTNGDNNIGIGVGDYGGSLLLTGSNNICIGNKGNSSDAGIMRFGTNLTHSSCFIAGIRDVTTNVSDAIAVMIDSSGQLGTVSSSGKGKKDIASIGDKAQCLNALNPVSFSYKSDGSGKTHFGLVAEEVATVCPELVIYNKSGDPETVAYHELPSLLLAGYQQHEKAIEEQKKSVTKTMQEILDRLAEIEKGLKKK